MKEYIVEWFGKGEISITKFFDAESESDAFDQAVKRYKNPKYSTICISWDGCADWVEFNNPHFGSDRADLESENRKFGRSIKPTRSDGSVGWFENAEGSTMTEKQILLAQLAELRTIKRYVVSTVVIVIVIPIIVGGLVSG